MCLIIKVSLGYLPRRGIDSSQGMYVFSFSWCCQSQLYQFTRPHTQFGSSHFLTSPITVDIAWLWFAYLMDKKYYFVELMSWIRNNIMLWNWIFIAALLRYDSYCKIYPFQGVQFCGFRYIHKDVQPSLLPSFRRNPLPLSSHTPFSPQHLALLIYFLSLWISYKWNHIPCGFLSLAGFFHLP